MEISFLEARKKLAIAWFSLGLLLILLFFIQTLTGRYDLVKNEAWEWFSPNIIPILFLIAGSLFAGRAPKKNLKIERVFYLISLYLSLMYLLFLFVIILGYSSEKGNIIEYYKSFNMILVGVQALVNISLGLFFSNKK